MHAFCGQNVFIKLIIISQGTITYIRLKTKWIKSVVLYVVILSCRSV